LPVSHGTGWATATAPSPVVGYDGSGALAEPTTSLIPLPWLF